MAVVEGRRPVRTAGRRSRRTAAGSVARWIALIVAVALFLLPFYLIVRDALSTETDIVSPTWRFFPHSLRWSNVKEVFDDPSVPFARSLLNSLIVAVLQTGGQIVIAGLAGYGLARIPYRWSNTVFYSIIATLMIPSAVTFVPSFVLVSYFHWISTLQGIIVPVLFSGFSAFLFRQYFLNFPRELEEAGRVDGLGYLGAFWRIVIPNSLGFVAAIAVIDFVVSWNSFLWPLVVGSGYAGSYTVQVALSSFVTAQNVRLHELFMAAGISIVPLVLVFVFLQRYLVEGVAQTGIKG